MSEVDVSRERLADFLMIRKLFSVVSSNGVHHVLKGSKQADGCLSNLCRTLAVYLGGYCEIGHSLHDSHQGAAVAFANDGVYLPVAHPGFVVNNLGAIVYAYTVLYLASCRFSVPALVVFLALLTKVCV